MWLEEFSETIGRFLRELCLDQAGGWCHASMCDRIAAVLVGPDRKKEGFFKNCVVKYSADDDHARRVASRTCSHTLSCIIGECG